MRFLIPALALSLMAVPALAQTSAPAPAPAAPAKPVAHATATAHPRMTHEERFDAANTTHDGKLTKEQAHAAHMYATVKHWDAIDRDKKGYVTMDDLKAYAAAQRAAHHAATSTKKPPA